MREGILCALILVFPNSRLIAIMTAMRRFVLYALPIAALILVLWYVVDRGVTPAQKRGTPVSDRIVAHVNGEPISEGEYLAALAMVPENMMTALATPPGRKSVVEQVARMRLLAEEALARGADRDPEVQGRLMMAQTRVLANVGLRRLLSQRRASDLRRYYDEHIDRFTKVKARQIILGYDEARLAPRDGISRSLDETMARAAMILDRLEKGEDFSTLAREFSDDPTGPGGGETGEVPRASVRDVLGIPMFDLEPDEISGAITTAYGVHIILMVEKFIESFEEVEALVEEQSFEERVERIQEEILAAATVEFDEEYFETKPGF